MRSYAAAALVLLSGCRADPSAIGQFEGPPPFMPAYPGTPDKALANEIFFEHPGCEGQAWVADDGDEFTYASVRTADACVGESGRGVGYPVH